MYTTDHILLVLTIKDLINEYRKTNISFKIATGTKPPVSHLRVLFCPCVVRKASANVDKKALNMCHQAQKHSVVYSLKIHSIKKDILCTYQVQGR